jgi:hypothetical protein
MDLMHLKKQVIWIPTPGQYEQIYLAHHLQKTFGHFFFYQQKLNLTIDVLKIIKQSN